MREKKSFSAQWLWLVWLAVTTTYVSSSVLLEPPEHDPVKAMQGLIKRRLGSSYNDQIELKVIPTDLDGLDKCELVNDNGKLEIAGNSATAMAYCLHWYLKNIVHTQMDWDNHALHVPSTLPTLSHKVTKARESKYTYYQNVCTVSYSSWTWGWDQWEKHIDWMALNGINMPLAFTGQEYIWQKVFKDHYNMSQAGLDKFFAGSAFLAWGRMGNIRGSWVKGPLPQKFIDDQFDLQLKILDRMKDFGMIPALPAFAGHVPEEFKSRYPEAKITRSPNWGNFTDDFCCVYMLDPADPLYVEVGKTFIEQQTKLYNYTSHLYQCDTFNEMDPDTTDTSYLVHSSKAVIESMRKADSKAIWLMQGWLFLSDYWQKDLVKAYLSGVPDDQMIILDLYSEVKPIWNNTENYFGKPWIYCVLHNFGGNTGMRGDLLTVGTDPIDSRSKSDGTMVGVGLTMEGIYQNYVVYDLTLQMSWEQDPVHIPEYVKSYVLSRYHQDVSSAQQAWEVLSNSVYNCTREYGGVTKNIATVPPHWKLVRDGFMPSKLAYDPRDVTKAWKLLLDASDALAHVDAFRHDLVDVTRQYLSDHLLDIYQTLNTSYHEHTIEPDELCQWNRKILRTIKDLDAILETNEDFLLGRWLEDAKALAGGDEELASYYEYEARNQVTRWGDNNHNALHDYACKEWAGLVKSYYLGRWRIWLNEVCQSYREDREVDQDVVHEALEGLELKWQLSRELFDRTAKGDAVQVSKHLYALYVEERVSVYARQEAQLLHAEDALVVDTN